MDLNTATKSNLSFACTAKDYLAFLHFHIFTKAKHTVVFSNHAMC